MSGVGKGVTSASIAKIMQEYGFNVTCIKIDPYINFDAGTLRPTEHGEVWVTYDGGEIDQDLGNYERFLGKPIPKINNMTTGQIYKKVIDDERAGKFLGKTVQFIPHIPNEIKRRVKLASKDHDIAVIEIGGTIGDYENVPFLFALKSLETEIGKENIIYMMVTYLPIPHHFAEMKTKPTQQAIRLLTEQGIIPNFIVCRSRIPLDKPRKKKIETYANIRSDHIISEPDIDTIYRVPLDLEKEMLGAKILYDLRLRPTKKPIWGKWRKLVNNIVDPQKTIKVAMVGKYVSSGHFDFADSYVSVNESLKHAAANLNVKVDIDWIDSNTIEKDINILKNYQAIVVPGGFGATGVEGIIKAIRYAREKNIPYLGLCYGMQLAIVEFARNVCNIPDAHTSEVTRTENNVIDILPDQREITQIGGTMRLGAYRCELQKSITKELYKKLGRIKEGKVTERHRHRYEVNPSYIEIIKENGMMIPGTFKREDGTILVEFIELPKHKYFVATQSHPEFQSTLTNPSPLFYGLINATL